MLKAYREGDESKRILVGKDSWQWPEREEEGNATWSNRERSDQCGKISSSSDRLRVWEWRRYQRQCPKGLGCHESEQCLSKRFSKLEDGRHDASPQYIWSIARRYAEEETLPAPDPAPPARLRRGAVFSITHLLHCSCLCPGFFLRHARLELNTYKWLFKQFHLFFPVRMLFWGFSRRGTSRDNQISYVVIITTCSMCWNSSREQDSTLQGSRECLSVTPTARSQYVFGNQIFHRIWTGSISLWSIIHECSVSLHRHTFDPSTIFFSRRSILAVWALLKRESPSYMFLVDTAVLKHVWWSQSSINYLRMLMEIKFYNDD